jgi:hypothetical protein
LKSFGLASEDPKGPYSRGIAGDPVRFEISSLRAFHPARERGSLMADTEELRRQMDEFRKDYQILRAENGKVILGQGEIVSGVLIALIAGGHVLLEGVPRAGQDPAGAHPGRRAPPEVPAYPNSSTQWGK